MPKDEQDFQCKCPSIDSLLPLDPLQKHKILKNRERENSLVGFFFGNFSLSFLTIDNEIHFFLEMLFSSNSDNYDI